MENENDNDSASSEQTDTDEKQVGPQTDGANDSTNAPAKNDTHNSQSQDKGPPGGFDPTPMPKTEAGFTAKITFHGARSLPIADVTTLSSDPYIRAEIYTDQPMRHKEEPHLKFRTKTEWETTDPDWEGEWIVAHLPASGFRLKARIYDEDCSDRDDRLGNVHVNVDRLDLDWPGIKKHAFKIQKRSGSWRAYAFRAMAVCIREAKSMSGELILSVEVLGRSPEPGRRAYTVGPNYWCKHFSPLLGRIANSRDPGESKPEANDSLQEPKEHAELESKEDDEIRSAGDIMTQRTASGRLPQPVAKAFSAKRSVRSGDKNDTRNKPGRFNFQANQIQLKGPVPEELYHRFFEFKPLVSMLFTAAGVRGLLLNKALHHQHNLVYNFNRSTEYGMFEEPGEAMTRKFLELVRWDEGGRIFTYVITLDALLRFTETGEEYGIDLLSKHSMHADADMYVAWSGEFFVRRVRRHDGSTSGDLEKRSEQPDRRARPTSSPIPIGPQSSTSGNICNYELVIDNDSGTYRPNGALLHILREFLVSNFPGLRIRTLDCQKDQEIMDKMKKMQHERKTHQNGRAMYTQVPGSESSMSREEATLDRIQDEQDRQNEPETEQRPKHKLAEAVLPFVTNPKIRERMMTKKPVDAGGSS